MTEHLLVLLAGLICLGIAAQWLAWLLRIPAILLLLIFGFMAGPVTGFLQPDKLFGELLFPIVSLCVAIILFEGGLSLKLSELRASGSVVRNLISVGALITWIIAAGAAHFFAGLDLGLAILLGAILIVTGPTVIIPLLRHVQPTGQVRSILKWEGILIDPIGAMLAVLVFEALIAGSAGEAVTVAVAGFFKTIVAGIGVGLLGAALIVLVLYRHWVPDFLQSPFSLMAALAVFALANWLQAESGLLAVTMMGVALANQNFVSIKHIIEFKENLRVLLIAVLFIALSARLEIETLMSFVDAGYLWFLASLVLLARPLTVLLSTWRSDLSGRERALLAWVAPRGIVAAAVSSVFALRLTELGYAQAEELIALTFMVIIGTVAVYGVTAAPLARWLGVAQAKPHGALMVGAHSWARSLARAIQQQGLKVLLVDTDLEKIDAARAEGFSIYHGSIIAEDAMEELELDGIGCLLAITYNDEVNALAALHFAELFGRANVFHLAPRSLQQNVPRHLRGRILFGSGVTYMSLTERFEQGASVQVVELNREEDYVAFEKLRRASAIPLLVITPDRKISPFTLNRSPRPQIGDVLIILTDPTVNDPTTK